MTGAVSARAPRAARSRGCPARVLVLAVMVAMGAASARLAGAEEPGGESSPPTPAEVLTQAQARLADADYQAAAELTAPLADDATLAGPDRAEALRVLGVSLFLLGRREAAERALLDYLKLEPDGRLDPALVPPEGIVFFEDVRARHAGELRRRRPRPQRRFATVVSLVPVYGQVQNGDRGKAWVLGGVEVALLGANLTTYALLARSCGDDLTCSYGHGTATTLRTVNLASGAVLIGVVAYGMLDGYYGHHRIVRREAARLAVTPVAKGAGLVWSVPF